MPTRENLLHLESLIDATTLLLDIRKNVDKVEQDIRVMMGMVAKVKRDEQLGDGEGGEEPMDVDQEGMADDDDAGMHPGRGARKKNVSGSPCRETALRFEQKLTLRFIGKAVHVDIFCRYY